MNPKLKSRLIDAAVVLGLIGAGLMSIGVACVLGAILSMIFGGTMTAWCIVTILVDLGLSAYLIKKLVTDYWDQFEKTNMP